MKIIECEQRTDKWYQARLGKATASQFQKIMANGIGRKTYMMELLVERLTGKLTEFYVNDYMQWGIDTESQARAMYELITGNDVEQVGFCELNEYVGCSPDGLIGNDGLLEIKCLKTVNHLEIVLSKEIPKKYIAQVQGQLYITERKWCDFMAFDPRVKDDVCIVAVERDDDYIAKLEMELLKFVDELKIKEELFKNESKINKNLS